MQIKASPPVRKQQCWVTFSVAWMCVGENPKRQREDDLIVRFFWSLEGKQKCPSPHLSVCITATPVSTNVSSNVVCQGPEGRILSHVPRRVKFTTSHLCICLNQRKLRRFDTRTGWKHFRTSQTHRVFVWCWTRYRKEGWVYLCCPKINVVALNVHTRRMKQSVLIIIS